MPNPILLVLLALSAPQAADTLDVPALTTAPHLDGVITEGEYGQPSVRLRAGAARTVNVWVGHTSEWIYLTALIPDTSFYWGDDLVISLDADGSGGEFPGPGDRQWYLRRTIDSSRVITSEGERWFPPGREPAALGAIRSSEDWEVVVMSTSAGWVVEARLRLAILTAPAGVLPRIAIRTYDDRPEGWSSWPAPAGMAPQRVEHAPGRWVPLRILD
jgi:hypothetical protein